MEGRRRSMEGWPDFPPYILWCSSHTLQGGGGGGGLGAGDKLNHHGGVSGAFFLMGPSVSWRRWCTQDWQAAIYSAHTNGMLDLFLMNLEEFVCAEGSIFTLASFFHIWWYIYVGFLDSSFIYDETCMWFSAHGIKAWWLPLESIMSVHYNK